MLKKYIEVLMAGQDLSQQEAGDAMEVILSGQAVATQLAAFSTALKGKGDTAGEHAGFPKTLIAHADHVPHKKPVLCNCGTGGDAKNTFNISTTSAFVLAAGGVQVAKHGNRSASSRSGAADVLEALGVNVNLPAGSVGQEIDSIGLGFLFAPALNKAMKYVAKTRRELGYRTVFNMLGPIINPAGLDYQCVGIYDGELTHKFAEVLRAVGVKHALVFHSEDGMDEISTFASSKVSELKDGNIIDYEINPQTYGFVAKGSVADYRGGEPADNARITLDILEGREKGAKRDIVLLNAAAAFYAADRTASIAEGLELAAQMLDSGKAAAKLQELIDISNELEQAV